MKYKAINAAQGSGSASDGELSKNICGCCGEVLDPGVVHASWSVVTAQVEDGHPNDTYFVSDDDDLIGRYARSVKPLMIYSSSYRTRADAEQFVEECLDGYDRIDPRGSTLQ